MSSDQRSITLRPEVLAFARAMERELRAHEHKPGWKSDAPEDLLVRVHDEYRELGQTLHRATSGDCPVTAVVSAAADVANMAMMVADVCEPLVSEHDRVEPGGVVYACDLRPGDRVIHGTVAYVEEFHDAAGGDDPDSVTRVTYDDDREDHFDSLSQLSIAMDGLDGGDLDV